MKLLTIGAGIMGLSVAWAMARRGHDVTVVEQASIPNPLGSSVDQHRLIRYAYGDMAGYTAMVGEAFPAWDKIWQDLGESLYIQTGTLAVGTAGQDWLNASAEVLQSQGHAIEMLAPRDLSRRFPLLTPDGVDHAFYLKTGGTLLAGRIIELLSHHLALRGVTLMPHQRVVSVDPDGASLRLEDGRYLRADRLIVAAGPWVRQLLPGPADRVVPSRQVVAYLTPPADEAAEWARMPMVLEIEPDRGFYLVPPVAGTGLKVSDHSFSMTGDPDTNRDAGEEETRALFQSCANRLASFDRFSLDVGKVCFYTVHPPAERFVVEPIGNSAWLMTGFSGHGFKFGPLLGEAVADALEDKRDGAEVARWAAGHLDTRAD